MIRVIKPYICFEEIEEQLRQIMESGMLTTGEYSEKLPEVIKTYTGAGYAFNSTSATTALAMTMELLGIGEGDEVIVSDFSFPATVNVIEQRRARPVFADVDRSTYNTTVDELEKRITKNTKAVVFVCALGNPTNINDINDFCKDNSISLVVDAACAIGSSEKGKKIGNIGDLSCFSFHPRKLVTSGEGGMITTNNQRYAEALKIKLKHGAIVEDGKWKFVDYGFNYRLPEIQCMMLIRQIEKLDSIISERTLTMQKYSKELSEYGFIPQRCSGDAVFNVQSATFTVPDHVDRDKLIKYLRNRDIETVMGTYSLSNCDYYRNKYNDVRQNSLWLQNNTICLPCYHGLDENIVIKAIKDYFC